MSSGIIDHDRLLATLASLPSRRQDALNTLPRILTEQGEGHITVSVVDTDGTRIVATSNIDVPEGTLLPTNGIVATTAREGRATYLANALEDRRYESVGGVGLPVEFALPIFERDRVVAVLNIEREEPFTEEERRTLEVFTYGVGRRLTESSHNLEVGINASLSAALADARTLDDAAAVALEVITPAVGAHDGVIMIDRRGSLKPLAHYQLYSDPVRVVLEEGVPCPNGLAWRACLTGEPHLTRDYRRSPHALERLRDVVGPVILTIPIGGHDVNRAALILHFQTHIHISEADVALLGRVCRHLSDVLDSIRVYGLQDHLLDLHTRILESETTDVYQHILDAAIEHVPGAEAGSLLVRRDPTDAFRFQAASGYDLERLKGTVLEAHQVRAWHAGIEDDWRAGRARVLAGREVDLEAFSIQTAEREDLARHGAFPRLKATACLPVVYHGHVLAVLNLESFTREEAFGRDSLRALTQFAPPVAGMLAHAHHRDEIVRVSVTDATTGLTNRRGFKEQLDQILARATRTQQPFTVLLMDLTGFKAINDALGHDVGDEALTRVAAALTTHARTGDVIGRWGGDEFTAILPDASSRDADVAARRFAKAVASIEMNGHRLGIDIGAASYPEDGADAPQLMRIADERMYRRKGEGRTPTSQMAIASA